MPITGTSGFKRTTKSIRPGKEQAELRIVIYKIHILVLVIARKNEKLFLGLGVYVTLQALGANFLHHTLHRGVDAPDCHMARVQVRSQKAVAGCGNRSHHAVGPNNDEALRFR